MLMRDTGMRNVRELYRLRIENIDFNNRVIFNPNSKTAKEEDSFPLMAFLQNSAAFGLQEETQGSSGSPLRGHLSE